MTPLADLAGAWRGLGLMIAGKPEASREFNPTFIGLLVALGWLVLALLLVAAAQSMAVGMPSAAELALGFAIHGVTIAVLTGATALSLNFLKLDTPLLELLVPIIYAMGLVQLMAVPLALLGPNMQLLALLVLGLMIWRAARILGNMNRGVAIAFALLCFMLLVVVPAALYMSFVLDIPSPA